MLLNQRFTMISELFEIPVPSPVLSRISLVLRHSPCPLHREQDTTLTCSLDVTAQKTISVNPCVGNIRKQMPPITRPSLIKAKVLCLLSKKKKEKDIGLEKIRTRYSCTHYITSNDHLHTFLDVMKWMNTTVTIPELHNQPVLTLLCF